MADDKTLDFRPANLRCDAAQISLVKELFANGFTSDDVKNLWRAVIIANTAIARALDDSKQ